MEEPVPNDTNAYDSNISYQTFSTTTGGSDSNSKLQAISFPDLAGKRFLDLGCNAGFFCAHADKAGASYTLGVDNSPRVIKLARERHPNLDFLDTGWDKFPEGEFDITICLSAIHYAKNQIHLAQHIWTHLSVNGLFILEGGLIEDDILSWTDLPVVAFREVADRVRHLSVGFLDRHMLTSFKWNVVKPSVLQGGDPIQRFVIHAHKRQDFTPAIAQDHFRLCPLEYAKALAISAPTIQDNQPSYTYIQALANLKKPISSNEIASVFSDPRVMALFADDIAYAINGYGKKIMLRNTLGDNPTTRLTKLLQERNIEVEATSESSSTTQAIMRRMQAGVEFANEASTPGPLSKILEQCELSGAKVADLSGLQTAIWNELCEHDLQDHHLIIPRDVKTPNIPAKFHIGKPWELSESEFDLIFFDATVIDGFDHVDGVNRLTATLKNCLKTGGQAYMVLRTGIVQTDWDVYNPILLTPIGKLPSSEYLYNELLSDFAVRPLIRLTDDKHKSYSVTRIFRLTPRQPTLMVVIGHSQAGKTTLARCLRQMPDAIHLSSDYLFYELFRLRTYGLLPNCSQRLLDVVSGGTPEEVGNFFRTIESDTQLFKDYLTFVISMIPKWKSSISLDLDLRIPARLNELKSMFSDAGFSVWVVTR